MNIHENNVVSLKHFSTLNPITSVVAKAKENAISLLLPREFVYFDFLQKDPATITLEMNGKLFQTKCTIKELNVKNASLELETSEFITLDESRKKHRYSISAYTDVIFKGSKEKLIGRVKNISAGGFMIETRDDCENKSILELDMHLGDKIVPVEVELKRKLFRTPDTFEYGVKIKDITKEDKAELMYFLEGLNKEEKNMLKRLKEKV